MKSSRPAVGEVQVLEDHDDRRRRGDALEERAPGAEELVRRPMPPLEAEQGQQRAARSSRAPSRPATCSRDASPRPLRGSSARRRSRRRPARPRTISPSAQNVMPSP